MKFFFDDYKNFGKLEKKIENGILGVMKNFGKKNKIVKYFVVKK